MGSLRIAHLKIFSLLTLLLFSLEVNSTEPATQRSAVASPPECAMETLGVTIDISSPGGTRTNDRETRQ